MTQLASFLVALLASALPAEAELTPKQLAEMWTHFAQNDDAGTQVAIADIQRMVRSPNEVVPFLQARLQPVNGPDRKHIEQLITDLDSQSFPKREKAAKELEALGPLAGPTVEAKLKAQPSLEARRRLESLRNRLKHGRLSAEELQTIRAIEVLRGIGTPAAISVLENLAKGADGVVPTVEAQRALADLKRP